jgi:hypothetical protein
MKKFTFELLPMIILALTLSCQADPNPTASQVLSEKQLSIAYPAQSATLKLDCRAPGMLRLIGYGGEQFVSGSVQYNREILAPVVNLSQNMVTIAQNKIGDSDPNDSSLINLWKLKVSDQKAFALDISNLSAEGHWNLSGLPVTSMTLQAGQSKNALTTDQPNPTKMNDFRLNCSTGEMIVEGILNSNCQNLRIAGGSGSLTLRFNGKYGGTDLKVSIDGGTGLVRLALPVDIPSRLTSSPVQTVNYSAEFRTIKTGSQSQYFNYQDNADIQPSIDIILSGNKSQIWLESIR